MLRRQLFVHGWTILAIDLDEIRPDRFVIHNDKVRPLLRGEGVTAGKFFELGTWRRDGLLARIRERGFNVRTIADRIAALPHIQPVPPPGELGLRILSQAKERFAVFDPKTLHWQDVPVIEHNGKQAVQLRAGEALRRRKGRGSGDYYLATIAGDRQINLLPVNETGALLHAYAQIAHSGSPAVLRYTLRAETTHLPQNQALLPPPHGAVIALLARDKDEPWTVNQAAFPLLEAITAKLGLALQPQA
ncbi:MAG: hypothetical protein M3R24_22085 [Chloroflexota bacterium]|nr:hypothetical protein [Chloroflexota bacterium]PLS79045.1 MAG: hypothetical protein CYG59_15375 [Chloroflexota bacterium]